MNVTAIIPTRNMADMLDRAIRSVIAQTHEVADIIVADDHSTDHTLEVCGDYGVMYLYNESEQPWGICGGRNEAFKHVETDYVLPLDADDYIDPTYVEKTIAKMEPNVGIVSTEMIYHGKLEGMITPAWTQTYESELQANNITVTSLVRSQAILMAGPWDPNLRGWEDWDMWLRILKQGYKHDVVHEPLFHYRLNDTGMNNWADNNKKSLYKYLAVKHPGFAAIRAKGEKWNEI